MKRCSIGGGAAFPIKQLAEFVSSLSRVSQVIDCRAIAQKRERERASARELHSTASRSRARFVPFRFVSPRFATLRCLCSAVHLFYAESLVSSLALHIHIHTPVQLRCRVGIIITIARRVSMIALLLLLLGLKNKRPAERRLTPLARALFYLLLYSLFRLQAFLFLFSILSRACSLRVERAEYRVDDYIARAQQRPV